MKRKIRVWGKLNLLEVSGVGIPAYPYATLNNKEVSLAKSLAHNFGESTAKFVEEIKPIKELDNQNYKEVEKMEETTNQVQKETSLEVTKTPSLEEIQKAFKDALAEVVKSMPVERGLVETEKKPTKTKSLGELAMEMGLFKV